VSLPASLSTRALEGGHSKGYLDDRGQRPARATRAAAPIPARQRILAAAASCCRSAGTSSGDSDIGAAAASVGSGIYRHFRRNVGGGCALFDRVIDDLPGTRRNPGPRGLDPAATLAQLIEAHLRSAWDRTPDAGHHTRDRQPSGRDSHRGRAPQAALYRRSGFPSLSSAIAGGRDARSRSLCTPRSRRRPVDPVYSSGTAGRRLAALMAASARATLSSRSREPSPVSTSGMERAAWSSTRTRISAVRAAGPRSRPPNGASTTPITPSGLHHRTMACTRPQGVHRDQPARVSGRRRRLTSLALVSRRPQPRAPLCSCSGVPRDSAGEVLTATAASGNKRGPELSGMVRGASSRWVFASPSRTPARHHRAVDHARRDWDEWCCARHESTRRVDEADALIAWPSRYRHLAAAGAAVAVCPVPTAARADRSELPVARRCREAKVFHAFCSTTCVLRRPAHRRATMASASVPRP